MTETQQSPPPAPTPPPVVIPEPNSRLEQLTAEWGTVKPQLDELAKREKELSQAIKRETAAAAPEGASEVVLRSPYLPTPYRLHQVETWRLDAKRLKATEPVTYARWATKSVSWRLDAVK